MAVYVISYDLKSPGRNYSELYRRIKSYSGWAHIVESTWAVVSTQTSVQVRDYLSSALDSNDRLFVGVLRAPAAWTDSIPDEVSRWLKRNLK